MTLVAAPDAGVPDPALPCLGADAEPPPEVPVPGAPGAEPRCRPRRVTPGCDEAFCDPVKLSALMPLASEAGACAAFAPAALDDEPPSLETSRTPMRLIDRAVVAVAAAASPWTARPPPAPAMITATVAAAWPNVMAEPADGRRPRPARWWEPPVRCRLGALGAPGQTPQREGQQRGDLRGDAARLEQRLVDAGHQARRAGTAGSGRGDARSGGGHGRPSALTARSRPPSIAVWICSQRRPLASSSYSSLSLRRARNRLLSTIWRVMPSRSPISS